MNVFFHILHKKKQNNQNFSDESCLEYIKQGQVEFFEYIYTKRSPRIYTYLLHLLNYIREDAEEVLGDVFISFFHYIQKNTITNVSSFLYRLAHNKAIDRIKKKENETKSIESYKNIPDTRELLLDKVEISYEQKYVVQALMLLSEKEREVVHLAFFEEKTYEEIANIIGSNKNTVGTILFQAKKKLAKYLRNITGKADKEGESK